MLEGLSFVLNNTPIFDITLIVDPQHGCIGQVEALIEGLMGEEDAVKKFIYGKDIYDFFSKIDHACQGHTDYKEFRQKFYGLHAISKMKFSNQGACLTICKTKKLMYREEYDKHMNLEIFFEELHTQISTISDWTKPIEKLTAQAEESIRI